MKISEGLHMLEIPLAGPAGNATINPVLIYDESNIILVDTGLPGQLQVIQQEIKKLGIPFEKLGLIIITHQDLDHIGNLSAIKRQLGDKVKILSHSDEKPYIEFEKRPVKLTPERMAQMEANFSKGKDSQPGGLIAALKTKVDSTVEDGQELPLCGGIKVIHTPGHTPGHICLYLNKYKTLISGDALNVSEGRLVGPNPKFTYEMEQAMNSLRKLTEYDIETVICYHGGICSNSVNNRIEELAVNK